MKIYIVNILPHLIKDKMNTFYSLFGEPEKKIKYELCSKEFGIHIIEDQTIYHVETTFNNHYELIKGFHNCDLLVDKTIYTKNPVISQLPVNYITSKYIQLQFKTNYKSKLSLILDCVEEFQDFELNTIPINFYFQYDSDKIDLNDSFFQEEFNVFLSNLN